MALYSELRHLPIQGAYMWLDVIALLVMGFFIGQGALRGGFATGFGLLTLVLAYTAAIVTAPRLGPGLARELGMPELVGVPLAGTAAFAVTYLGIAIAAGVLKRARFLRRGGPSVRDRLFGGVFGALRGGLVVLLVSWLAIWVDALRTTGIVESVPAVGPSVAASVTETTVEKAVRVALADRGSAGRLAASVAARPGASLSGIQRIVENPRLEVLASDEMFWTYVEHGSIDAAINRASFIDLAFDAELRSDFSALGLLEGDASDPGAFLDFAGEALREVGPRIRGLREDQAFQRLKEDPEVRAMVADGNTMGLLVHEDFRALVKRFATAKID